MFSTEGLPGIGVGGWWAPGLLNGQHQEKEEKRMEKKTVGEEE